MTKKITKVICFFVALIMCAGVMCACNKNDDDFRNPRNGEPEAGEFYTLQEAYDNGWLSKGDLRNISYHKTGDGQRKGFRPTPKNPEMLSAETELAIKEDWAKYLMRGNSELEAVADGIFIRAYYGIYEGLIAVYIEDMYYEFPDVICKDSVGGIEFKYGNTNTIKVWKSIE